MPRKLPKVNAKGIILKARTVGGKVKRKVLRVAYTVKDVARNPKRLSLKNISRTMAIKRAEYATSDRRWGEALDAWKGARSLYKDPSLEQMIGLHRIRSSISMISRITQADNYKKSIETYNKKRTSSYPRIALYTAISGNYDTLKLPERLDEKFDYIVFSDSEIADTGVYQVRPMPFYQDDLTRAARYVKTHPHQLLGDYDLAIWIDANVMITGDIWPMVEDFIDSKKHVGVIPHPIRNTVYEELDACVGSGKDDEAIMKEQVQRYEHEGFDGGKLVESNLMIFDMKRDLGKFFTVWWNEINQFSRRDQLSLPYAMSKQKISHYELMKFPQSLRNHPNFVLSPHGSNRKLQVDFLKIITGGKTINPYGEQTYAMVKARYVANLPDKHVTTVVCVHNALTEVKLCLAAIELYKIKNQDLIIVDDGSDKDTQDYLKNFAKTRDWVTLHRNKTAGGYTKAANKGLMMSKADLTILVNSDAIVTKDWVAKMLDVIEQNPGTGIIGPMSSAASHQSLPDHLSTKTQTAVNDIPDGLTPEDMNKYCEEWSPAVYAPQVPLVHGFCMGITRQVIDAIGYLDEKSFPRGYGEESDYCFRAGNAGFRLMVATHTYVFHAKSKSYADEKRIKLMKDGSETLASLYGPARIQYSIHCMQHNPLLVEMRKKARELYDQYA